MRSAPMSEWAICILPGAKRASASIKVNDSCTPMFPPNVAFRFVIEILAARGGSGRDITSPVPSDAPHGFQASTRVDFGLRQNGGLGAKALDDRAHERPDAGRRDEDRDLAGTRRLLEALAHERDELGQ